MELIAPSTERPFTTGTRLAAWVVIVIGLLALAGWMLHVQALTGVVAGLATMKANTALCFVLAGSALLGLGAGDRPPDRARWAPHALGATLAIVAAATLSQDLFGWNAGIDQLLVRGVAGAVQTSSPGRMSPATAFAFVLAGVAVSLLAWRGIGAAVALGQALAAAVGSIALVALMGYLLGVSALYHVRPFSSVALNTAVAFLVLAIGLLAARACRGWMGRFTAPTGSAWLARRLVLVMFAAVPALAVLRQYGEEAGWYPSAFGIGMHAVAGLFLMLGVLWFLTGAANRAEDRAARLNRVREVLGAINALIVRSTERAPLLRESCRIMADIGGYPFAWIGLVERDAKRIVPAAQAGAAVPWDDSGVALLDDSAHPVARAVLSTQPIVAAAVQPDAPHAAAPQPGSMAALPLVVAGQAIGVIAVHAPTRGAFDPDEIRLLEEIAGDVAFALDHIGKEQQLNYLAYHDALTGLANRTLFHDRLVQHIVETQRANGRLALVLIDVAQFHRINASLGRHAGDEVLREIGKRFEHAIEPVRLARTSADHFALVLPRVAGAAHAARTCERIAAACFAAPFAADGEKVSLQPRFGIAQYPEDGADAEALYRSAEEAIGEAKQRNELYRLHDQNRQQAVRERLRLEAELRDAVDQQQLELHYQPKVQLRGRRLSGAEALMRWRHPHLGDVPPARFIPIMEETRLILAAGAWALGRAAADARQLAGAGIASMRIGVNVSAVQLHEADFAQGVMQSVGNGLAAHSIELEITESTAMEDVENSIAKLKAARDAGFALAIDDFGTGYSSLAYLARIPAQSLKIDRAFVRTMLAKPEVAELVRAIVGLGHALGMTVVAEGVETEAQAAFLDAAGCDEMQGDLVSPPLPFAGFIDFALRARS